MNFVDAALNLNEHSSPSMVIRFQFLCQLNFVNMETQWVYAVERFLKLAILVHDAELMYLDSPTLSRTASILTFDMSCYWTASAFDFTNWSRLPEFFNYSLHSWPTYVNIPTIFRTKFANSDRQTFIVFEILFNNENALFSRAVVHLY